MSDTNYREEARSDAQTTAQEFLDQIVESFFDNGGEASKDLFNDYSHGDSYHHENHVDKSYTLLEAAELLDQLSDYEETDSGLWESLQPREAICAQAAYTYGNAVYRSWEEIIDNINDDSDLEELADTYRELNDKKFPTDKEEKQLERVKTKIEKYIRHIVNTYE